MTPEDEARAAPASIRIDREALERMEGTMQGYTSLIAYDLDGEVDYIVVTASDRWPLGFTSGQVTRIAERRGKGPQDLMADVRGPLCPV